MYPFHRLLDRDNNMLSSELRGEESRVSCTAVRRSHAALPLCSLSGFFHPALDCPQILLEYLPALTNIVFREEVQSSPQRCGTQRMAIILDAPTPRNAAAPSRAAQPWHCVKCIISNQIALPLWRA